MEKSCDKIHKCGHLCNGFAGEKQCLPCLNTECVKKNPEPTLGQNEDSFCTICGVDRLSERPSVKFNCQHIFHLECVMEILNKKWTGPRVMFNFLNCTSCKRRINAPHCPEITTVMTWADTYEAELKKKAIERGMHEGLEKDSKYLDPGYAYHNKFEDFCLFKLAYYECYKCKVPYFGGLKDCQMNQEENKEDFKKEELVCAKCASHGIQGGVKNCKKHGLDFIEFKCKFCCNISQWFCWGNTHFCEPCHKKQNNGDYVSRKKRSELPVCPGAKLCPLKIQHPPNGEEYALGCALCREEILRE